MNKPKLERYIAALLFIMVLVIFSFAQRDTKKLEPLYTQQQNTGNKLAMKTEKQVYLSADTLSQ